MSIDRSNYNYDSPRTNRPETPFGRGSPSRGRGVSRGRGSPNRRGGATSASGNWRESAVVRESRSSSIDYTAALPKKAAQMKGAYSVSRATTPIIAPSTAAASPITTAMKPLPRAWQQVTPASSVTTSTAAGGYSTTPPMASPISSLSSSPFIGWTTPATASTPTPSTTPPIASPVWKAATTAAAPPTLTSWEDYGSDSVPILTSPPALMSPTKYISQPATMVKPPPMRMVPMNAIGATTMVKPTSHITVPPSRAFKALGSRFSYVVNTPIEYDANESRLLAKIEKVADCCHKLENENRHVHLLVGINKKEGAVTSETLTKFVNNTKLKGNVSLVSYLWSPVKEKAGAVNYTDIRNKLFHHPTNYALIEAAIANGVTQLGDSTVKILFLDPDTQVTSAQLNQAEQQWQSGGLFHVISSVLHRFDLGERLSAPLFEGHGVNWEAMCVNILNMHDWRVKSSLKDIVLYECLPTNCDLKANSNEANTRIAQARLLFFESLEEGDKKKFQSLKNSYSLLLQTAEHERKNPPKDDSEAWAISSMYDDLTAKIKKDEQRFNLRGYQNFSGEMILYPCENLLVLSLFDRARGIDLYQTMKSMSWNPRGVWGNGQTTPSGRGEGEQFVASVSSIVRANSQIRQYKVVDFDALNLVQTAMPPRFAQFKPTADQRALTKTVVSVSKQYQTGFGFSPRFLKELAILTGEKPESSLQSEIFEKHRTEYIAKNAPIKQSMKPLMQAFFSKVITKIQEEAQMVIASDINRSLLRELFFYRNRSTADLLPGFDKQMSKADKEIYDTFRFFKAAMPWLFDKLGERGARAFLGYAGFGY